MGGVLLITALLPVTIVFPLLPPSSISASGGKEKYPIPSATLSSTMKVPVKVVPGTGPFKSIAVMELSLSVKYNGVGTLTTAFEVVRVTVNDPAFNGEGAFKVMDAVGGVLFDSIINSSNQNLCPSRALFWVYHSNSDTVLAD